MTDKEKLIEQLRFAALRCDRTNKGCMFCKDLLKAADELANGVTVHVKTVKPPTDLTGKCGSCVYTTSTTAFGGRCYVKCTNEEHLAVWGKNKLTAVRQRTAKACKHYKAKAGESCE